MPRKKVSPIPTITKLVIDFDNLPEETMCAEDLKAHKDKRPWSNKPKRKNGGRANQNSQFNTAINKELNAGRALAIALEHQHKITFG